MIKALQCQKVTLAYEEVHVWKIMLPVSKNVQCLLSKNLSQEERLRANRFHFNQDREIYIISRGILKELLSYYLQLPVYKIQFSYNSFGKPYIQGCQLCFNVSHSGCYILIGVTQNGQIGVDVEKLKPEIDHVSIAEQFFSNSEYQEVLKVHAMGKSEIFFRIWTRKEAVVKALGLGFSFPIEKVEVGSAGTQIQLPEEDRIEQRTWYVEQIQCLENYMATIAVSYKDYKIKVWEEDQLEFNNCLLC